MYTSIQEKPLHLKDKLVFLSLQGIILNSLIKTFPWIKMYHGEWYLFQQLKSLLHVYWHIQRLLLVQYFSPGVVLSFCLSFGKAAVRQRRRKSGRPLKYKHLHQHFKRHSGFSSSSPEFQALLLQCLVPSSRRFTLSILFTRGAHLRLFHSPCCVAQCHPLYQRTTPVKAVVSGLAAHSRTAHTNITDFPGPMIIPLPVLPRNLLDSLW